MNFLVDLNLVENVKQFVKYAEKYDKDIIVKNMDRAFIVDGSSIMAMFSLDLSKPVIVEIQDRETAESFMNDVKDFIVQEATCE